MPASDSSGRISPDPIPRPLHVSPQGETGTTLEEGLRYLLGNMAEQRGYLFSFMVMYVLKETVSVPHG